MSRTTPTDEQLNRAIAEAFGWTESPDCNGYFTSEKLRQENEQRGWGVRWKHLSNLRYCTDREFLPEILDAVVNAGIGYEPGERFGQCLPRAIYKSENATTVAYNALRLPMRSIVIAALKALGKWPSEWENS